MTLAEYQKEIVRVQEAIDSIDSKYLRRDYSTYLKRLKKEVKKIKG